MTNATFSTSLFRDAVLTGLLCSLMSVGWAAVALLIYGIQVEELFTGLVRVLTLAEVDAGLVTSSLVMAPLIETAALLLIALVFEKAPVIGPNSRLVVGFVVAFAFAMLIHGLRLPDIGRSFALALIYAIMVFRWRSDSWGKAAVFGAFAHLIWNIVSLGIMIAAHAASNSQ